MARHQSTEGIGAGKALEYRECREYGEGHQDEGASGRSRQAPKAPRRKRRQRLANHLPTKGSRLRWNTIGRIRLERQAPKQRRQGTKTVKYRAWGHQSGRTPKQQNTRAKDTKVRGPETDDDERLAMMRQKLSHPQAEAVRDRSLGALASRAGISRGGAPPCALASAPDLSALAPGPDVSHLDAPHPATSGATPPV